MVNNEFGKLKSCVVGTEFNFSKRNIDFTFKNMYRTNLGIDSLYDSNFTYYEIDQQIISERREDLDNLEKVLIEHGVDVIRPKEHIQPRIFNYLNKKDFMHSAASNVRDIVFTYKDLVIETRNSVINRIHENQLYFDKVKIKFPDNKYIDLTKESFSRLDFDLFKKYKGKIVKKGLDLEDWSTTKDRLKQDMYNMSNNYTTYIDAANMIKINDDIICNIGSINQYLGYMQLKQLFEKYYPEVTLHEMYIADSHIDGTLIPLKEGVFLANEIFLHSNKIKEELPSKFKNWEIIYAQDRHLDEKVYWDLASRSPMALASSRGMDINVLSLDRDKILIQDDANRTIDLLGKHGFTPIPIKFRHGEIFAGGIHCSTLDLDREE